MIKGMTGFGSATISSGKIKGAIEIKSQNHRYFDLVYYLPTGFSSLEENIRQVISREIQRGRVTFSLKITERPPQTLTFHKDVVQEYLRYANVLKKDYGLKNDLMLSDLIRLPGVVSAQEDMLDTGKLWPAVEKSLEKALKGLMAMRIREGRCLLSDVLNILRGMRSRVKTIRQRAQLILKEKRKVLSLEEFTSYQKNNDINEELIRLAHYIEEFDLNLRTDAPTGKKLDFVAQEMQRETNTIGSKVQDKEVASAVVSLKSKIEKLREQAQNIE